MEVGQFLWARILFNIKLYRNFFLLLILFRVTTGSFEQFFWALMHFFSSLQFILPNSPSRISWSILSWEVAITWSFYWFLNLSQANDTGGSSPMELKIADWVKGVHNHLYWCAASTKEGFQEMITVKWKSFMEHVANKHENCPYTLFKKCAHEEIDNRQWIRGGIV